MILTRATILDTTSLTDFGWGALRRFHNIPYVEDLIIKRHSLSKRERPNAKKQAAQIRYCLMQAEEYFNAGSVVTPATRPVLYYYSIMSLALAEILMKHDGLSSLDKAREQHRHHGLLFSTRPQSASSNIDTKMQGLLAKPMITPKNVPFGTFALWHRSSREMPAVGKIITDVAGGQTITHNIVLGAADVELPRLDNTGISLFDCISCLPSLRDSADMYGIAHKYLRANAERHIFQNGDNTLTVTAHPTRRDIVTSFFENCLVNANLQHRVTLQEFTNAGIITLTSRKPDGPVGARFPHGMNLNEDDIYFWPKPQPLNEFGYFYTGLFIVGNYARYFPDQWLRDVDARTDLSILIEDLLLAAKRRMALLALSELSGTYFVPSE